MANVMPVIIVSLLVMVVVLGVHAAIAAYVYRDARMRGLNAWLWTLVAIFVPGFIGLIIYLMVRGQNQNRVCPYCHRTVESGHLHCPYCGHQLKENCPHCQGLIEPSWTRCAHCGGELNAAAWSGAQPKRESHRGIYLIIVLIVIVPILLVALILAGVFSYTQQTGFHSYSYDSFAGTTTLYNLDYDPGQHPDLIEGHSSEVEPWLNKCRQDEAPVASLILRDEDYDEEEYAEILLIYLRGEKDFKNYTVRGDVKLKDDRLEANLSFRDRESSFTEPNHERLVLIRVEYEKPIAGGLDYDVRVNGEPLPINGSAMPLRSD